MPRLAETLEAAAAYALGRAQVPTFTNPNNVTIVTGVSAARNGDRRQPLPRRRRRRGPGHRPELPAGDRRSMPPPSEAGVGVLCVTAKDKLRALLATGGVPPSAPRRRTSRRCPTARRSPTRIGAPNPDIYDWRLSPYTVDLAVALAPQLRREARLRLADRLRPALGRAGRGRWPTTSTARWTSSIGRALDAGFVVGLAADHGMRAKSACRRQPRTSASSTTRWPRPASAARHTLCPITDPYVVHHAALGSLAWVHLDDLDELDRARGATRRRCDGVEGVLDRSAAAEAFELPADRIGDLIVLADGEHGARQVGRRPRPERAAWHAALTRRPARARPCR